VPPEVDAMGNKISPAARVEFSNAIRQRYRSATPKEKQHILKEFIAVSGYHPKSAIRVLNIRSGPGDLRYELDRAFMTKRRVTH
jgi:hypothetical protein